MKDLERAYSKNELKELRIYDYFNIKLHIKNWIDENITDEEKSILEKYEEICNAPYHYLINPFYLDIDKQTESLKREIEIEDVIKNAASIIERISKIIPPNIKATQLALIDLTYDKIKYLKR